MNATETTWASRGYVVAAGLLSAQIDSIAHMVDEVGALRSDHTLTRAPLHVYEAHPRTAAAVLSRTEDFVPSHRGLGRLLRKGALRRLVAELAGEPVTLFKDKINYKLPGGAGYAAHQDGYSHPRDGSPMPSYVVMVAVDNFSLASGAPQLAPEAWVALGGTAARQRRQRRSLSRATLEAAAYEPVELRRGDVLVYDTNMPHRAPPNRSPHRRAALFAVFTPARLGDLRATYFAEERRTRRDPDRRMLGGRANAWFLGRATPPPSPPLTPLPSPPLSPPPSPSLSPPPSPPLSPPLSPPPPSPPPPPPPPPPPTPQPQLQPPACRIECAAAPRHTPSRPAAHAASSAAAPLASLRVASRRLPAPSKAGGARWGPWWDGVLHNTMYVPRYHAIVCAPPKAGCTSLRALLHFLVEGQLPPAHMIPLADGGSNSGGDGDSGGSGGSDGGCGGGGGGGGERCRARAHAASPTAGVHDWFFEHPLNLARLVRGPRGGELARDLLLRNASVRRVVALRAPWPRFVSALLDKGDRLLGREMYWRAGCAGPKAWANGSEDRSGVCALAGSPSISRQYDAALEALEGALALPCSSLARTTAPRCASPRDLATTLPLPPRACLVFTTSRSRPRSHSRSASAQPRPTPSLAHHPIISPPPASPSQVDRASPRAPTTTSPRRPSSAAPTACRTPSPHGWTRRAPPLPPPPPPPPPPRRRQARRRRASRWRPLRRQTRCRRCCGRWGSTSCRPPSASRYCGFGSTVGLARAVSTSRPRRRSVAASAASSAPICARCARREGWSGAVRGWRDLVLPFVQSLQPCVCSLPLLK